MYFRGLRRILKKKSTYIDRWWTHNRLFKLASALAGRVAPKAPKHVSFIQYYRTRRRKRLGHLLRTPPHNLCRLAILTPDDEDLTATRRKKRVGRPRQTWLQEVLKDVWETIAETPFNYAEEFLTVKEFAINKAAPF